MSVIVISGMPGSGNSTVGRLLAKKLKLKFFSVGKHFKDHEKTAKKETERALKLMKTKKGSSSDFHHGIDNLVISLADKGDIVIEGKIAIRMVGDKADLRVWLKALPEVRAQRYSKRDKTNSSQSAKNLEEKERIERKVFKDVYGFDFFAQEKNADNVIDTSDKTPDEIVDIILRNLEGGYKE
ncbi:hypothetical protein CL614_06115 [archaeon]|nr:hypothetical protein [archaeon]|tara:strand:+ start:286 stop:834 length:549 start_codon:yes stop_codon:yes gene_type:complete